ncbi:c-type cytochrome [Polynucleobacter sp. CS-Odin-A6]|uniref:c-type cytochrome n=1 Tax=Polynucleobacter sp. CS-Odin-A6 TaxID=2689106 RepID=UPI001C0C7FB0|nr:c-type cytochrome [Polynucleobacter sp. CS-Odin-A6]MBU3621673.1 c-type cytochrome [Polynucleobacter sp. CS-Odin-A6]
MCKWDKFISCAISVGTILLGANFAFAQSQTPSVKYPGIGRHATIAEVAAWDIDVRPDFKGLPKGSGSVAKGQEIWEAKCASCHGTFGDSNEIFTPIAGGTTKEDIKTGRVASLNDMKQPQRTTLMKVATVSTLWDYIYRAMPWNAPRSLTPDDTYALVAFTLSLGDIVPDDFVLSNNNIADIKMPNRNGMTTKHGLWSVDGKPDVNGNACMNNCVPFVQIGSTLPDFARNAHENIADQNRMYGPYRGADTTKPPLKQLPVSAGTGVTPSVNTPSLASKGPAALFKSENCSACHASNTKLVGPSITDVANKYKGQSDAQDKLMAKVKSGGAGVWGAIPMPPQAQLSDEDRRALVTWMLSEGK